MIGKAGRVELSPDIVWRLRPLENSRETHPAADRHLQHLPRLHLGRTSGSPSPTSRTSTTSSRSKERSSICLRDNLPPEAQRESIATNLPRFNLRGHRLRRRPRCRFPATPPACKDFELDGIQCNSLGTVRVFPKRSVIEGTVLWKGGLEPGIRTRPRRGPGRPIRGTRRPAGDAETNHLDGQPTLEGKLQTLRGWFRQNFKYSRTLSISSFQLSIQSPHRASPSS